MSDEKTTVSTMVEGGQASAGPPLGPELGPLPVDVGEVVSAINEETEAFDGMEVPVDVEVDEETGDFSIEVGTPPVSALIKDELGFETGSGKPHKNKVADMDFDTAVRIARMKESDLNAMTLKSAVKEIIGSAQSLGVTVDGEDAFEVQRKIENGEYDQQLEDAGEL